ncbi:hypothetical protein MMC18_009379 [Xylographa bjoerkii]|nr:hypothetical protein [Xylographa bjoerkii]
MVDSEKLADTNRSQDQQTEPRGANDNVFLVTWDSAGDPANPLKWTNVLIICLQAIVSPMLSTMLAIADFQTADEFHFDSIYTPSLPVALLVFGLGVGPLYLAPISELHGRRVVYMVSYLTCTVFNLGTAFAPNMTSLAILRFFAGVAGSAGHCLGGSSLRDMCTRKNRGRAQAIYTFGTTTGPLLGGVVGALLLNATGNWRWLLWIMIIVSGITILFTKWDVGSYDSWNSTTNVGESIVGIYYLQLTTIPLLWGPTESYGLFSYKWKQDLTGLAYLGGGIGDFVGMLICAIFYGRLYTWMCTCYSEDGTGRPEFRTTFMQLGMLIKPIGLFMFGWTAEYQLHWICPLLGVMIFCCGMLMTYISIQTYMVDAFDKYAAGSLAALVVCRQSMGAIPPIFGFQLYHQLGCGW